MKRNVGTLGMLFLSLTLSSAAHAQDAGSDEFGDAELFGDGEAGGFGFDEAPPAATSSEIELGLAAFERGDFAEASLIFYGVYESEDWGSGLHQRAQFELGRTLARMDLLQAALLFFEEIIDEGESHPHFVESAPWMVVMARQLPGDEEMLGRVARFEDVFPDRLPEEFRDEMAYMLGEHFHRTNDLERAILYMEQVGPTSPLHPRALYLGALSHIRNYDAAPAVALLEQLQAMAAGARGEQLERLGNLPALVDLTLGRLFYSTGEYDRAVRQYSTIRQGHQYWLDSLFESSWAYLQLDQYNRALGNLHSLNSPFFNDEYYPEAPVLQAVIFFYNCQFDRVRETLDEFNYVYVPLREELELTLFGFIDGLDAYEFLQDASVRQDRSRTFDARLQQIVDATLSDRGLMQAISFIEQLDREVQYVETAQRNWATSPLGSYLNTQLIEIRTLKKGEAGERALERLNTILSDLRQFEGDMTAILVETNLAEAGALSSAVAQELASTASAGSEAPRVHREQMYWTFDGEYWRDELGYYSYNIRSRCSADE